jgi:parvulin-like peptidyl-prolyl isomerase
MAYSPVRRSVFDSTQNFLALPALLLAGAALLAGCHPAVKDPKDPKFIVAEKGNWQVTRGELDKETASVLKQHQATPEQVGPEKMLQLDSSMLKNMVLKNLLLAKGATLQLKDVDKDEAAELEGIKSRIPPGQDFEQQLKLIGLTLDDVKKQIHEKVVIEKVLKAEAFKNDDPTEQEINDFYLKNKESITTPPQVRASRILVHVDDKTTPAEKAAKKKTITQAHDRVLHGEEFSKVAMQVSEDRSSAPKGGDIDYFRPGENEPGFDDVAFHTKQGAVSPVFETSLGYQFLKVTDIKPGGEVPLADVRPKIAAYLREMKMQEQEKAYVTKLLADSGVVYHVTLVDPPAQNAAASPGGPDSAPPSAVPASSASTPPAATNSAPTK